MIRPGRFSDLPAILDMGERFFSTTHYTAFAEYDRESVTGLIVGMLENGVLLMAEHDGQAVGMVGLVLVPFPFDQRKTVAAELMWYVSPDAQGMGAGKALLQAVEPACRAKGADVIQMIHLTSSPAQAGALYERMGFALQEHSYMKGLA